MNIHYYTFIRNVCVAIIMIFCKEKNINCTPKKILVLNECITHIILLKKC